MRNFLGALAFLACLICPAFAYADVPTIPVDVTVVPGKNSLTFDRARTLFSDVSKSYRRELRVSLVSVSFKQRSSKYPQCLKLDLQSRRACLRKWAGNWARRKEHGVLKLILMHPLINIENGEEVFYIGGMATGVCAYKHMEPYTVTNAEEFNAKGEERFSYSKLAVKHELGHLLGAEHYNRKCTAMHEASLWCALAGKGAAKIKFASFSKKQIKRCIG